MSFNNSFFKVLISTIALMLLSGFQEKTSIFTHALGAGAGAPAGRRGGVGGGEMGGGRFEWMIL
ncbi:MAG: hypothetical protein ACKVIX_00790, partial [Sphingomonadales bacterium]